MSGPKSYPVYKVKLTLAVSDPDMPKPRYHTIIFVETDPTPRAGVKYHVTGDITSGMRFEARPCQNPETSGTFFSKEFLGYVSASHYPDQFYRLLASIPAPPKQKDFNRNTMRTEPVKSWNPMTFYEPGEPRRPLMKCTEWTEQKAIPALYQAGMLVQGR